MEKMKLTSEQAIRITKLNGDAQDTIVDLLENCERIQKDKLMTPALLKACLLYTSPPSAGSAYALVRINPAEFPVRIFLD